MTLLGWNETSLWNDLSHDPSHSFNSQGQWSGVDDDDVFGGFGGVPTDDSSLDGGSEGHGFIRVDPGVRFLSVEEVFNELSDLWNSGGSSHQDDLVDLVLLQARVFEGGLHWSLMINIKLLSFIIYLPWSS